MRRTPKTRKSQLGPVVKCTLICVLTYIALFIMLFGSITPEQYDIKVGMPAPTQIKATKDVQDTVTTEALREAAAHAVEPSYKSVDPSVITDVMFDLSANFSALTRIRDELTSESVRTLTSDDLEKINTDLGMTLTRQQLTTLVETSNPVVENIFEDATGEVRGVLNSTLPEGQEIAALRSIRLELNKTYSEQLTSMAVEAVRVCLRPNMLIDEEITEANRTKAREAVQTEWCVKDEVIVREGEIVTPAQYAMIASLGILDEDSFDVRLFSGIALLVLIMMLATGFYLYLYNPTILHTPKQMMLLCLIVAVTVALCLGFRVFHIYLMPVSLGLMLVTLLLDGRLALFVNFMISMLLSMMATTGSGTYSVALMSSICGPIIVSLFAHKAVRTTPLLAGVIISVVSFLITLAVGFVNSAELFDVLRNAGMAAANGIISAVLCIGLQPLLEWLFNLATSTKLIELSNPNQPLLRRLLLEASGTYHHSIIVANLAEAACSAIGANGLLARVAAYYHDVGKLKRPMYFKENQMGDNPHDRTDPRVSTAILTAHTRDGAQLAQKARIPEPVVDIIRQHHGDTPVMFFYDKAQKLYGDNVDIAAFRYEGPRPQSREAAVVMLADTIEAATRALPNPDPEKIDALIRKLVRGKLNDGQLDSSSLTFSDLDKISSAFSTVLTGVFHERIEYPEVVIPPRAEQPLAPAAPVQSVVSPAPAAQPTEEKTEPLAAPAQSAAETVKPAVPVAPVQSSETPARPVITPGAPVPPVQNSETPARPVVVPGAPVPPVQNSETPARPVVVPGAPVPPVQNSEAAARPVVVPGAPVPPVQNSETAARPVVAPGAPVPPVQNSETTARPVVTPGAPVPPVQNSEAAARPVVVPGAPVPPVQTAPAKPVQEQPRPVVTPGAPVPPVQPAEPARPAAQPAAQEQAAENTDSSKGDSADGN